jgi:predicted DCC family thiol-disulfide oxidoreductase YuxK
MDAGRIVYFDGHCNVCNRFIDFLIRRDRRRLLKYAPLQGDTARRHLPPGLLTDLSTMVLEDENGVSIESTAAIRTIAYLGGFYGLIAVFLIVPRFVRDWFYRWVAAHRYLWWGKRDTCRIPTPEERAQFLP